MIKLLDASMPGLVISIDVVVVKRLNAGDKLCTIEAMKMENVITSGSSGIIKKILCNDGDSLASDQTILELS